MVSVPHVPLERIATEAFLRLLGQGTRLLELGFGADSGMPPDKLQALCYF